MNIIQLAKTVTFYLFANSKLIHKKSWGVFCLLHETNVVYKHKNVKF